MQTPRRIIIRTAWCLAKSYWTSGEKRSAWNLLIVVIVLNLGNVYIGVRINEWNRAFYNALQTFNAKALFRQVGIFGILVAFAVLDEVGLGELADELDKVDNWSARLSLGEQQGIVFARILLTKPKHLFLDEATSALDETAEIHLLGLLRTKSWRPTIVSVGHGAALRQFHEQTLDLCRFEPAKEAVVAQSNHRL